MCARTMQQRPRPTALAHRWRKERNMPTRRFEVSVGVKKKFLHCSTYGIAQGEGGTFLVKLMGNAEEPFGVIGVSSL